MKTLSWSLVLILLAGMVAFGDEPLSKETAEAVRQTEAERMRTAEMYYRKVGKPRSAEYYRLAAERAIKVTTVYVPMIKSDQLSRQEAAQVTEQLIQSIEQRPMTKVVSTPEEADLILEATLKPGSRPKP